MPQYTDLIERLREIHANSVEDCFWAAEYFGKAADAIEALTAEVEHWKEAHKGKIIVQEAVERLTAEVAELKERNEKMRAFLSETSTDEERRLRAEAARLREGITAAIDRHGLKGKCACSDCNFLRAALRGEEG